MIIFGTRGVTYSHGDGQFHCPSCGEGAYKHKRVRRFFTLYFIPLIPLDLLGEYIECDQCAGTYQTEILSYDPSQGAAMIEAEFHTGIRKVMVLMMLADGRIDDDEVQTIQQIYSDLAGAGLPEADVRREAAELEGASPKACLGPMVGSLNDHGKELIVKAAFMVAIADGEFPEEEQALLAQIGEALDMSAAHYRGVLSSLQENAN